MRGVIAMRAGAILALVCVMAAAAQAQTRQFEAPGSLAPTQDPGCLPLAALGPELSPADLGLGLAHCLIEGRYAEAADTFVLMGVRTKFDTYRVSDQTAHEAGVVIQQRVSARMSADQRAGLNAAFAALGGNGSPWHTAFCAQMRAQGVPQHDPTYMIAHGMGAFVERDQPPLVAGFDADVAWDRTLRDYMKCAP